MVRKRISSSIKFPKVKLVYKSPQARAKAKGGISKGMMNSRSIIKTTLSEALQKSMKTSVWAWPRSTIRKSGESAGSPRDIFDTGTLSRSQKIATNYSGGSLMINISYSTPYASLVHYGGAHRPYGDESRPLQLLPARPWIFATVTGTYGIEKYDMKGHLEAAIRDEWLSRFNPY
jgi:hypothetical protein